MHGIKNDFNQKKKKKKEGLCVFAFVRVYAGDVCVSPSVLKKEKCMKRMKRARTPRILMAFRLFSA